MTGRIHSDTTWFMFLIDKTTTFDSWLLKLRDNAARVRIIIRIKRMEMGNLGDVKTVGQGVYEARISYGPGYRLYYAIRKRTIIWLLCGGDKGSQKQDIQKAHKILKEVEKQYG